ncbi:MAG TPA: asparagine synthase-related protein [Bryobacteraceae bacterium]|nr:asparagine synthase-related protein [Bryobacteraceae bacterium]
MSAIFGFINLDGRPANERELELMGFAQAANGKHGGTSWISGNVGLGQRLECFTPEDCLESPPEVQANGRYVLVCDARIDNRPELVCELGIPSADARALPDSAFILRSYEKWGADCPGHLIGAFVFALCDLRENTVLIARCPMGERSLFFHRTSRRFAFASAPRGLFALPSITRRIDAQSVADFLVRAPKEPGSSFFEGIETVQAGHSIVITRKGITSRQYRGLNISRERRFARDSDYVDAFNALFDRVVADQMRSATPVAISMSGGLDSTAIAASAALTLPAESALHTFTEVPPPGFKSPVPAGRYADETPYIEAMGRRYDNLNIHFVCSDGSFYLDHLDAFFCAAETPLRNASNWTWMKAIFEESHRHGARVLLTGTSGNLTATWDGAGLLPDLLRSWKWKRAIFEARALARRSPAQSAARILLGRGLFPLLPDNISHGIRRLRDGRGSLAATPVWLADSPIHPEFAVIQRVVERAREKGHTLLLNPARVSRGPYLIRQADLRANDRRGIEALFGVQQRDPMADIRLVEFCLSLPEEQYLLGGESRSLIRRAVAGRLPNEVLQNRQRGLQAANWLDCFRAARPRIKEVIEGLEKSPAASAAIDLARLRSHADGILNARADSSRALADYRGVLDRGIATGCFLRWVERGE